MSVWWLLALIPIGLNLFASRAVLRAPLSTPAQRVWQLALVWLLPVIGAVICLVFAASQAADRRSTFGEPGDSGMWHAPLPSDGHGGCASTSGAAGDCGGGDGGGGGGGD